MKLTEIQYLETIFLLTALDLWDNFLIFPFSFFKFSFFLFFNDKSGGWWRKNFPKLFYNFRKAQANLLDNLDSWFFPEVDYLKKTIKKKKKQICRILSIFFSLKLEI